MNIDEGRLEGGHVLRELGHVVQEALALRVELLVEAGDEAHEVRGPLHALPPVQPGNKNSAGIRFLRLKYDHLYDRFRIW